MKCYVTGKLDGSGACYNEATQIGATGEPVCDECAKDVKIVAEMINVAAIMLGESPKYIIADPLSDN